MDILQKLTVALAPTGTQLVAVTKRQSLEDIQRLYDKGQRVMAENRVQDLLERYEALPKDIEWHLIGTLQTNKVKYIVPFIKMIHSVDSLKLLQEIDRRAAQQGRVIDCLLQFHVAQEDTKQGLDEQEAINLLSSNDYAQMKNVRICGVMGMATFTEDQGAVRQEFKQLKGIFDRLKLLFFEKEAHFKEISMGMSGDYQIAVEEGSTMVRVGSLLFEKSL